MKFKKPHAIAATARLKIIATGTAEIFKLDPRILTREPGFNTRYDFGDVAALAEDIAVNGVIDPLKVRKDGATIYLVNGDRRLTAVEYLMEAGRWPEDPRHPGYPMPVPCSSEGKGTSPQDRIFMMLSLNTGKPFTLLEKGYAYVKLLDHNQDLNASEIARRTGETKQAVSNALCLIRKGSPALIQHIKANQLSATTALEIIKLHPDHPDQDQAAAEAISSATANGRSHATPKNLAKKASATWTYTPSVDFKWNEHGVATAPTRITLTPLRSPFATIELMVARFSDTGNNWGNSFSIAATNRQKLSSGGLPSRRSLIHSESDAIIQAWRSASKLLRDIIRNEPEPNRQAAIDFLNAAGHALHSQFVTGEPHDESIFNLQAPFIADLSDESDNPDDDSSDDSSDESAPSDPSASSASSASSPPDTPADPSAYDRLKSAPSTHRDGTSGAGPAPTYASHDDRLKKLEKLMDDLDPDTVNSKRWNTAEIILDFFQGNRTIADIREFLIQ